MANYTVVQLDELEAVKCLCGFSQRAFVSEDNKAATLHMVSITEDARVHYHKKLTEIYLILEGSGYVELDGQHVPAKAMTAILIKPGCRHRAVGNMRVIVVVVPAFDAKDEWFD